MSDSRRPHPPKVIAAVRAAAAQGMYCSMIARSLDMPNTTVRAILKREGIATAPAGVGRPRSTVHRDGDFSVPVPGWVPPALAPDFIASARMYGEEKAASIVRRLKADAMSNARGV